MSTGGDLGAGRRLRTAVRAAPRALRHDLLTVVADPLPPVVAPRWLARLPHLLVVLYGALLFELHHVDRSAVPITAVQAVAVPLAMFRPVLAWWVVVAAMVGGALAVGDPYPWSHATIAALAGVLFLLALRARPRVVVEALAVGVLAGLASVGFDVHNHSPNADWPVALISTDVGQVVTICGLAAVVGAARRARRLTRARLTAQESIAAEERARRTLLEERTRIARELHDVVAHHLSVISIQAQVAPHLVTDPSDALTENLASIRGNALEALAELRRVLGVLRVHDTPSSEPSHVPQPTLAQLDELVGNVRDAGLAVTTRTIGQPRPLPPGVELSAYRIVQEALSNAIRHAPGAAVRVEVAYQLADLLLQVRNTTPTQSPPPPTGAGHGLLGMRERVAMLGGKLSTGPTPDGGYEVVASLPAPTDPPPVEDTVCRPSAF
ncbi:sensor histidine kinase [Micromonospora echinaurantiaca]|uniref:sensor histidine kinase n=1 Tax=Micromonospora echinaurantiaca TaxID=47857 RepID=UPI00343C8F4C